jgi:hypothetical protein
MTKARYPAFLSTNDEPHYRVRCPIHGFIHFSPNERRIIDHPIYRRLRHVRQLALTEYLYPGANHTRFEHSLGVMEVATRAFDSLAAKHGDRMEATFQQVAGMEENTMQKARQFLRIAALLHDVGHAAFSHAAEDVVQKTAKHEALSVEVIKSPYHLGTLLKEKYGQECVEFVPLLIESADLPPQLRLLRDLISSQMDADRTDYLLRDAYHCGVEYGKFDYLRMIESMDVSENDLGGLDLALHRNGIHAFEAMVLARYQMNTQVYYHRVRRIYDQYLIRYHQALSAQGLEFNNDFILANNDVTMMARIMEDAKDPTTETGKWAARIVNRNHHREVFSTPVTESQLLITKAKSVAKELLFQYNKTEQMFDLAKGNIHKLLRREDSEGDWVELKLTGTGNERLVTEDSQVLKTIPRAFFCARIFADAGNLSPTLLQEMRETARQKWQSIQ